MKTLFLVLASLAVITKLSAQQFLDKAVIEYEVKTNIKKTMEIGRAHV